MAIKIEPTAVVRPASKMALCAAAARWRATQRTQPLCSDPWSGPLAGDEGQAILDEVLRGYPDAFPTHDVLMGLRAVYIDAHVVHHTHLRGDVRQVVLLGAGLDTRAARLGREGVTYYEVDHPESQAYKLRSVRQLDGYPVDAARYVACDIEHHEYLEMLISSGFRPDQPALFIMEGIVHYLTEAVVQRALTPIASACDPRSTVLFDYISGLMDIYEQGNKITARYGEPLLWMSDNPLPLLRDIGFRHVRTVPFEQLFTSATGERCFRRDLIHTCFLARATRETPASPYTW